MIPKDKTNITTEETCDFQVLESNIRDFAIKTWMPKLRKEVYWNKNTNKISKKETPFLYWGLTLTDEVNLKWIKLMT